MISTNSPSNFSNMNLCSGQSACRYAPGTSKVASFRPSCASMINDAIKVSNAIVGEVRSSDGIYFL